jgi:hypothetical protein
MGHWRICIAKEAVVQSLPHVFAARNADGKEGRTGFSLRLVWPRNELGLSSHDGAVGVAEWNGILVVLVPGGTGAVW